MMEYLIAHVLDCEGECRFLGYPLNAEIEPSSVSALWIVANP